MELEALELQLEAIENKSVNLSGRDYPELSRKLEDLRTAIKNLLDAYDENKITKETLKTSITGADGLIASYRPDLEVHRSLWGQLFQAINQALEFIFRRKLFSTETDSIKELNKLDQAFNTYVNSLPEQANNSESAESQIPNSRKPNTPASAKAPKPNKDNKPSQSQVSDNSAASNKGNKSNKDPATDKKATTSNNTTANNAANTAVTNNKDQAPNTEPVLNITSVPASVQTETPKEVTDLSGKKVKQIPPPVLKRTPTQKSLRNLNGAEPSEKLPRAPENAAAVPAKEAATAANATVTPEVTAMPVNATVTPAKVTAAPVNATVTPAKVNAAPVNATEIPENVTAALANKTTENNLAQPSTAKEAVIDIATPSVSLPPGGPATQGTYIQYQPAEQLAVSPSNLPSTFAKLYKDGSDAVKLADTLFSREQTDTSIVFKPINALGEVLVDKLAPVTQQITEKASDFAQNHPQAAHAALVGAGYAKQVAQTVLPPAATLTNSLLDFGKDNLAVPIDSVKEAATHLQTAWTQGVLADPRESNRHQFLDAAQSTLGLGQQLTAEFVSLSSASGNVTYTPVTMNQTVRDRAERGLAAVAGISDLPTQLKRAKIAKNWWDIRGAFKVLAVAFPDSNIVYYASYIPGTAYHLFTAATAIVPGALALKNAAHDVGDLGGSELVKFTTNNWRDPLAAVQNIGAQVAEAAQSLSSGEPWDEDTLDSRLALYDLCHDALIGSKKDGDASEEEDDDSPVLTALQNLSFNMAIQAVNKGYNFTGGLGSLAFGAAGSLFAENSFDWYPSVMGAVGLASSDPLTMVLSHFANKYVFENVLVPGALFLPRGYTEAQLRHYLQEKIYSKQFKTELQGKLESFLKSQLINPEEMLDHLNEGSDPKKWSDKRSKDFNKFFTSAKWKAIQLSLSGAKAASELDVGELTSKGFFKAITKIYKTTTVASKESLSQLALKKINKFGKQFGISTEKQAAGWASTVVDPVLTHENPQDKPTWMLHRIQAATCLKDLPSKQEVETFISEFKERAQTGKIKSPPPVENVIKLFTATRAAQIRREKALKTKQEKTQKLVQKIYIKITPLLQTLKTGDEDGILNAQKELEVQHLHGIEKLRAREAKYPDAMEYINLLLDLNIPKAVANSRKRLNSLCFEEFFRNDGQVNNFPKTYENLVGKEGVIPEDKAYKDLFAKINDIRLYFDEGRYLEENIQALETKKSELKNLEQRVKTLLEIHQEPEAQLVNESLAHFMKMTLASIEKADNAVARFVKAIEPLKNLDKPAGFSPDLFLKQWDQGINPRDVDVLQTTYFNLDELRTALLHLEDEAHRSTFYNAIAVRELGEDYGTKIVTNVTNILTTLLQEKREALTSAINSCFAGRILRGANYALLQNSIRSIFDGIENVFSSSTPISAAVHGVFEQQLNDATTLKDELTRLLFSKKVAFHLEPLKKVLLEITNSLYLRSAYCNIPGYAYVPRLNELEQIAQILWQSIMATPNEEWSNNIWIEEINKAMGGEQLLTEETFNQENIQTLLVGKLKQHIIELIQIDSNVFVTKACATLKGTEDLEAINKAQRVELMNKFYTGYKENVNAALFGDHQSILKLVNEIIDRNAPQLVHAKVQSCAVRLNAEIQELQKQRAAVQTYSLQFWRSSKPLSQEAFDKSLEGIKARIAAFEPAQVQDALKALVKFPAANPVPPSGSAPVVAAAAVR